MHGKREKGARDMICCQTRELPNGWLSIFSLCVICVERTSRQYKDSIVVFQTTLIVKNKETTTLIRVFVVPVPIFQET